MYPLKDSVLQIFFQQNQSTSSKPLDEKDISDNAHLNIFVADIDVDCVFSHVHLTKWFWLMDMDIDMWIHGYI